MSPLILVQEAVKKAVPEIMELEFGCEIKNIFWYKTESDKKKGIIDWIQTGHHEDGREGTIVKDLRSEFLPMWVDYGEQLEFQIMPLDIVSFKILGREIRLSDILRTISIRGGRNGVIAMETPVAKEYDIEEYFVDTMVAKLLTQWDFEHDSLSWHATHRPETVAFIGGLIK